MEPTGVLNLASQTAIIHITLDNTYHFVKSINKQSPYYVEKHCLAYIFFFKYEGFNQLTIWLKY